MASGKRILNPRMIPFASAQIQNIKSELTRIETLQKNISHATRELAMVEDSVASIENLLMRARELAVRGANDSLSTQDRDIIATEIDGLREQLLQLRICKALMGTTYMAVSPWPQLPTPMRVSMRLITGITRNRISQHCAWPYG